MSFEVLSTDERQTKQSAENMYLNTELGSGLGNNLNGKRIWKRTDTCMLASLTVQLCLILCDPMDCSPQGSSVYGIFQAGILEWVAISNTSIHFPVEELLIEMASLAFSAALVDRA